MNTLCGKGISGQSLGRFYNDNVQRLKLHHQAYLDTLTIHKQSLQRLKAKFPHQDKWGTWVTTEGQGVEDVVVAHIKTVGPMESLPSAARRHVASCDNLP